MEYNWKSASFVTCTDWREEMAKNDVKIWLDIE
jgi:hypothetical protein